MHRPSAAFRFAKGRPFAERKATFLAMMVALSFTSASRAADWPMWRYDAQRSGASPADLPDQLHVHWSRDLPPEVPAWPDQEKMPFDICYEPIVVGQTLYTNSSRHDCVRAFDALSGERKWIFFADGPVRFAPLHYNGKLYFTSDDGHLYCLNADSSMPSSPRPGASSGPTTAMVRPT
jgi:outer membrane protein assembly factor BamB